MLNLNRPDTNATMIRLKNMFITEYLGGVLPHKNIIEKGLVQFPRRVYAGGFVRNRLFLIGPIIPEKQTGRKQDFLNPAREPGIKTQRPRFFSGIML